MALKIGIFHTAFLGDVVLAGLLVEALSQSGHEVFFFTKNSATQIFEHDLRVRASIAVKKPKGVWGKCRALFTISRLIRGHHLDVLLVPHKSLTSSLIAWLSRIPNRLGFDIASGAFLYPKKKPFLKDQHECLRLLNLVAGEEALVPQKIFEECWLLARPVLKPALSVVQHFEAKHRSLLEQLGSYVVVAPGSVWATKKYPPKKWAEVIFALLKAYPTITCVLSGSGADLKDISEVFTTFQTLIATKYPHLNGRLIDVGNLFRLEEFGLFISRAQCVLANDSSPVHFAAGFGVPVVAVFGPTVKEFGFGPTSPQSALITYETQYGRRLYCQPCSRHGTPICPQGHHRCMKDIDVETVLQGVRNLIH